MARLNVSPARVLDSNANPISGGTRTVYVAETTTPVTTYADAALTTPHPVAVPADAAGYFPEIYLPGDAEYKVIDRDSLGATVWTGERVRPDLTKINYTTVSALLASKEKTRGLGAIWEAEGFRYEELPAGTAANLIHLTTAGGVLLKVLPGSEGFNAKAFGAIGNGTADDTAALQAALDAGGSLFIPEGTYRITSNVLFRPGQTRRSVRGVFGKTTILIAGGINAFTPEANFNAEIMEISGLRFVSETNGTGTAIYSPETIYVSHWHIHACLFNQSLRYGINANLVGCRIIGNDFGEASTGTGQNFQAIRNYGDAGLVLNPNANIIAENWIKRCGGANVDYCIEIGEGVVNHIEGNLIENNTPNKGTIRLAGAFYPKIVRNYFENNTGTTVVKCETGWGGRSVHVLEFDDNYIRGAAQKPSAFILDFFQSATGYYTFNRNLISDYQNTGLIRDKDGATDTTTYLIRAEKNHITGAVYSGVYANINGGAICGGGAADYHQFPALRIKSSSPTLALENTTGGGVAELKFTTSSSVELSSATGGHIYFKANGAQQCWVSGGGGFYPITDNTKLLGSASYRWASVYAANGTINTSDEREKTDIRDITEAEKRVAGKLKLRAFRWKSDPAKTQFGVIAQEVVEAFAAEGLDADDYGLIVYDEWEDQTEVLDVDGNVLHPAIPAGSRYGVRYDQLSVFLLATLL